MRKQQGRRQRRQPQLAPDREEAVQTAPVSTTGLLLLGLIIGLAVGLYYAWLVEPVVFVDASPARLSESYKAEYIFLVSQNYAVDGDWELAEQRLAALADPALTQTVEALVETYLREQKSASDIRNLTILAQRLGVEGRVIELFAPTPLGGIAVSSPTATATPEPLPTSTPTITPSPSPTPQPTVTATSTAMPTPTSQPNYRLLNQEHICDEDIPSPRIEVLTWDRLLDPLPGVEVLVRWESGSDHFFTGFKPDQGLDYGDFTMSPDTSYTIILADGSPEVSGLRVEPCANGAVGSWRLTFQNLVVTVSATETPSP